MTLGCTDSHCSNTGTDNYIPRLRRTHLRTLLLNALRSVRHMHAASTLAGEAQFGSDSIDITDSNICSMPIIGRHRSSAFSSPSSPGGCRMEMHTLPSL